MTKILTHRGLEPSNPSFFSESTLEAFKAQLERGYGIEFDLVFLADQEIGISHDSHLSSLTGDDFCSREVQRGTLGLLKDLLKLITDYGSDTLHAIHFKAPMQSANNINLLLNELSTTPSIHQQLLLFDLLPNTAQIIKDEGLQVLLGASVAHPYDILRYSSVVGSSLLSLEKFLEHQELYDLAWLDEWDLRDENDQQKKFYSEKLFKKLTDIKKQVAIVSPELHASSPGLLGGESHPDGQALQTVIDRLAEILAFASPHYICTDYPMEVRQLIEQMNTQ